MEHPRRIPRLASYDYASPGLYFVTFCTAARACVFGAVVNGEMRRPALGEVAHDEWERTLALRPGLVLDAFVVMPNHVHVLIGITSAVDTGRFDRRDTKHGVPKAALDYGASTGGRRFGQHVRGSVSSIVGAYKAAVTRRARRGGLWGAGPLWQGRFHDRIVRNAWEADRIRRYIAQNPLRWHLDRHRTGPPSTPGTPRWRRA